MPTALGLSVQGVDLRFGGIHALRGVSFSAEPGHITAVIGPNGAGKTSVFNAISGFYRPSAGSVYLGGKSRDVVPYVVVLAILIVRPYGIFGTHGIERL